MQITIVVTLCHTLAAIPTPVCKEASVYTGDMSMNACAISQAAIADWKSRSIFRNEEWTVQGYKCASPGYVLKDNVI